MKFFTTILFLSIGSMLLFSCGSNEKAPVIAADTIKPQRFIIKAMANNKYVSLHPDGFVLMANQDDTAKAEVFELIAKPDGKVGIQTSWGKYVGADGNIDLPLVGFREKMDAWELFQLIELADKKINIKTFTGKFVCADVKQDGKLIANRGEAYGWETFEIIIK